MSHDAFTVLRTGFGPVAQNEDTTVYLLENSSAQGAWGPHSSYTVPDDGGCFGFVSSGVVMISGLFTDRQMTPVYAGQYFTTRARVNVIMGRPGTKCVIFQARGYVGAPTVGEVEEDGRLGYIDGCRDTVLHGPLVKGLPCLNALFMPAGIHQTSHTHPSTRAGIIFAGSGECHTPEGVHPLKPGDVFFLKAGGQHKFRTDLFGGEVGMKLVAFHPDSDFGPTNEEHPMLNKTEVNGVSAKHLPEIQTKISA